MTFLDTLRSGRVLLMDGAMGTELQKLGLLPGECAERWNLTHADKVRAVHRAYIDAGAELILTHSFLANPENLRRFGLADQTGQLNHLALRNAELAARGRSFILADVGPFSGDRIGLSEMCTPFAKASAVLMETWSDSDAANAFLTNRRVDAALGDLPVLLSVTYSRDWLRAPLSGHAVPEEWGLFANRHQQVAALGVNCGRDMEIADCADVIRRYRAVTDLPLFARPNAGTPTRVGDRWIYPRSPEQMAAELPLLLGAGASMVGGCCGTTPAHIAAFRKVVDEWSR